jgi:hypothetical protein
MKALSVPLIRTSLSSEASALNGSPVGFIEHLLLVSGRERHIQILHARLWLRKRKMLIAH